MSYGTLQIEKMTTESGYSLGAGNASSFKNRIINGSMTFDQRNAGASVTPANGAYTLDRWQYACDAASKLSFQQVADAPAGFTYSLKATSLSAYSLTSAQEFRVGQYIEGYNFADFAFGTASAKAVTLSFWVKSSLTGTFGVFVANSGSTRTYVSTYTINAANTWEQKTVSISGDITGTWANTSGIGIQVFFELSAGSNYYTATTETWTASSGVRTTSAQTQLVSTNAATWQVTGVQVEAGTVATSFDFRSYGTELQLCQRYYQVRSGTQISATRGFQSDVSVRMNVFLVNPMRAAPTVSLTGATGWSSGPSSSPISDYIFVSGNSSSEAYITGYTATAEL